MSGIIDRPWAIVYGPKCKLGTGLLYGLGFNRKDAWHNAVLVMYGYEFGAGSLEHEIKTLKARGFVARKVEVRLP